MTVLELETKKAALARNILNQEDEDIINQLTDYYRKLSVGTYPCDYTEAEVLQACETAMKEYESGLLIPSSQIKRKIS